MAFLGSSIIPGISVFASNPNNQTLKIGSYNVLCSTCSATYNSDLQWENRKQTVIDDIVSAEYDVVGLQEVRDVAMLNDLREILPKNLSITGLYADGIPTTAWGNPIIYNNQRVKPASDMMSKELNPRAYYDDPGNPGTEVLELNRAINAVKFEIIESGQNFYFINTHLAYRAPALSTPVRAENNANIQTFLSENITEDLPMIITGDMNSYESSGAMQEQKFFTETLGFENIRQTSAQKENDAFGTFRGTVTNPDTNEIDFAQPRIDSRKIDYIFFKDSSKGLVKFDNYKTIISAKGSDHLPIIADFTFSKVDDTFDENNPPEEFIEVPQTGER